MNLVQKLILVMVLIGFSSCGDPVPVDPVPVDPVPVDPAPPLAVGTAHVYTNKTGGSVIYCPEELDPVPTEWTYNGTAEINEDDILEQCELE
jgi:hypothetical protein